MKGLGRSGTRRQLFKAIAAGAAGAPLILAKKSAAMGLFPRPDHPPHGPSGSAHCLLRGTSISTPSGCRLVEELQIGDEVHTLAGVKAIKWIGYNKFTKEEGRVWHDSVMPIGVASSALDDQSPRSDLYLSPLHCVFFNKALIPVKYLVNGTSIAQRTPSNLSAIEYYHVDLGTHEVLYAEGALVESFFDGESEREYFSNFIEYERLYGAELQPKMTPFAPILSYRNRFEKVESLARSLISNIVDVRDPIQIAREQIARRVEAILV
jgi:hypothetical protein